MQSLRERRTVNVAPLRPWRHYWRVHRAGNTGHLCLRHWCLTARRSQRHIRYIHSLRWERSLGKKLVRVGRLLYARSIAQRRVESSRLSQLSMVLKRRGLPRSNRGLRHTHLAKLIQTRLWRCPRHHLVWHTATDHRWIRKRAIRSHSWLWLSHVRPWIHGNWHHACCVW